MARYLDFEYSRIGSEIRIDKYTGRRSKVSIPSIINNLPVTSIGGVAFSSCNSLASIVIPNSVTEIGNGAFLKCSSLKNIVIPDSVTKIGDRTFLECSSLKNIVIPESVTSIGKEAFGGCRSLKSIVISDSVPSIGLVAFSGCRSLRKVYCSNNLKDSDWKFNEFFWDASGGKVIRYDFPSRLFGKIFRLESSSNISDDMLNRVQKIKNSLLSSKCTNKIDDVELILDNLITTDELQQKILDKIFRLESLPNISDDMLNRVQEIKKLLLSGKCTNQIGNVDSILDNFIAMQELQQKIADNPVMHLATLINRVSEEKINNASKCVQKFKDEIAKIEVETEKKFLALSSGQSSDAENQTVKADDFKHSRIQSGIQIDKYIGHDDFVSIPERLQNLPVTTIGYRAFDSGNLNKVVIPASVKTIVYGSFVSKEPLHVFFKGSDITLTPQSFIAPEVVFYFNNSAIAKNLYAITQKKPRYKINYYADDF